MKQFDIQEALTTDHHFAFNQVSKNIWNSIFLNLF